MMWSGCNRWRKDCWTNLKRSEGSSAVALHRSAVAKPRSPTARILCAQSSSPEWKPQAQEIRRRQSAHCQPSSLEKGPERGER